MIIFPTVISQINETQIHYGDIEEENPIRRPLPFPFGNIFENRFGSNTYQLMDDKTSIIVMDSFTSILTLSDFRYPRPRPKRRKRGSYL